MIRVAVVPEELTVGARTPLAVRVTNPTPGDCHDLVLRISLPSNVVLLQGRDRLEVPRLRPGESYDHPLTVKARSAGAGAVTSPNFSYRDASGQPVRVSTLSVPLRATEPRAPDVEAPEPPPEVVLRTAELPPKAWEPLEVAVVDHRRSPAAALSLRVLGPADEVLSAGWVRLPPAPPGGCAVHTVSVRVPQPGTRVPLRLQLADDHAGRPRVLTDELCFVRVRAAPEPPEGSQDHGSGPTAQPVLFLAASPADREQLHLDVELREVQEMLRAGRLRDQFRVESRSAVRVRELTQALLDVRPRYVHFAGHCASDGSICVEDDVRRTVMLSPRAVAGLFRPLPCVECVVINACTSRVLAEQIAIVVPFAIGMRQPVGDAAAIGFSVGFYQALAGGLTVPQAFDWSRDRMSLTAETGSADLPVLVTGRR